MAPGFALTFDDDYVSEWHGLRPLLARHEADSRVQRDAIGSIVLPCRMDSRCAFR